MKFYKIIEADDRKKTDILSSGWLLPKNALTLEPPLSLLKLSRLLGLPSSLLCVHNTVGFTLQYRGQN